MRRMSIAANNKKSKQNKKKTFQVPEVLQEWYVLIPSSARSTWMTGPLQQKFSCNKIC